MAEINDSNRTTYINVRCSDEEKERITKLAAERGLSVSAFVRSRCLTAENK